jgi:hypothetical protein
MLEKKTVETEAPKRQRRNFFMSKDQYDSLMNGIDEVNSKLNKLLLMPTKKVEEKTDAKVAVDRNFNGFYKPKIEEGFLQSGSVSSMKNNNGKKTIDKNGQAIVAW